MQTQTKRIHRLTIVSKAGRRLIPARIVQIDRPPVSQGIAQPRHLNIRLQEREHVDMNQAIQLMGVDIQNRTN
jgi:hypothetical protein